VRAGKPALEFFRVVVATTLRSRAAVTIAWEGGARVDIEAEGVSSMEALFRAIDSAIGARGSLTGLRVHAFTDHGLVGKARVRVNFAGREYSGRGSSPDPLEALGRAYLSAASTYLEAQDPRCAPQEPPRERPPRGAATPSAVRGPCRGDGRDHATGGKVTPKDRASS
jgi:hypothetical protein